MSHLLWALKINLPVLVKLKMGDGRGSSTSILMLLLCMLVFHSKIIYADEYVVGDGKGWSFGIQNWPSGKTFMAGDTLGKCLNLIKVWFETIESLSNTCFNF